MSSWSWHMNHDEQTHLSVSYLTLWPSNISQIYDFLYNTLNASYFLIYYQYYQKGIPHNLLIRNNRAPTFKLMKFETYSLNFPDQKHVLFHTYCFICWTDAIYTLCCPVVQHYVWWRMQYTHCAVLWHSITYDGGCNIYIVQSCGTT